MMAVPPDSRGLPERILRFVLLALLWGAWLAFRAVWGLAEAMASRNGRALAGKGVAALVLAAGIALGPKVAGVLWGRMLLRDAAEVAAMRSEGKEGREIEAALRRRAYNLGFQDIALQDGAVRVDRRTGEEGPLCAIEVDFQHRVDLYGWAAPQVRIHLKVEKAVFPAPPGGTLLEDLLS